MNLLKFSSFLACAFSLFADWNPDHLGLTDLSYEKVLNKQDLTDLKSHIFEYLQNSWCSKEKATLLTELTVLTTPSVCVEIGAFTGSSSLPILAGLQYNGQGKLYAIDAWSCEEAIRGLPASDGNTKWWGQLDMSAVKTIFSDMLNSWMLNHFCETLPITSSNAASQIPPIDFLHLDGNFSEEGALLDSKLYVPKVKSGGYILLSNVQTMISGKPSKIKSLVVLLDQSEVICEIDGGQTLLFRKN